MQYTLAIDRGNANLAPRFTPLHPAVLRLIQRTVQVARSNDIEVAVCGEMASQPLMAFALIGLGVRSMSVSPRSVPLLKRLVRGTTASAATKCVAEAMEARTAEASEAVILHAFARDIRRSRRAARRLAPRDVNAVKCKSIASATAAARPPLLIRARTLHAPP